MHDVHLDEFINVDSFSLPSTSTLHYYNCFCKGCSVFSDCTHHLKVGVENLTYLERELNVNYVDEMLLYAGML